MSDFLANILSHGGVWLLVIALPMTVAALATIRGARRYVPLLAPWATLPALVVALWAPAGVVADVPWFLLGAQFGLDETGRVFLFLTATIWFIGGVYAQSRSFRDHAGTHFFVLFLLTMAGNLGLVVSLDMASFYMWFAVMTFASYGLVIHSRSPSVMRAGRVYIAMAVIGEVVLFAAMVVLAQSAGTANFEQAQLAGVSPDRWRLVSVLSLLGLGVKAGVIGLHMWMPLSYRAAPTPAAAVMSGAMINAALIGWLRLLPFGQVELPVVGGLFTGLGLLAAFAGVFIGLMQRHPKAVLAYSSVSQMGTMVAALGVALQSAGRWQFALGAVLIYALHHALAKAALFLAQGLSEQAVPSRASRWLTQLALVMPALSLAGAPWTSGALAKAGLKSEIALSSSVWSDWLITLLPIAAVGTVLLMVRFVCLSWPGKAAISQQAAPLPAAISACVMVTLSYSTVWLWPNAGPANAAEVASSPKALWAGAYPVLAGIAIAWLGVKTIKPVRLAPNRLTLPAGDIVVLIEKAGKRLFRLIGKQAINRSATPRQPLA